MLSIHPLFADSRLDPLRGFGPARPARCSTSSWGPLTLQLLGHVVDLNRMHLTVTVTRGEGALGDLFCQLADNSSTTTTTTPTTTPTTKTA
ncbi:MAG: hypothetical protein ACYC91_16050 [Solirubrobacteraceae bacterium]